MSNTRENPLIGLVGGFPEQLFVIVRWMISAQLWKQALVAMLLAPLFGFLAFDLGWFPDAAARLNSITVIFGTIFLTFINLLVPPVVAFSVFVGIVSNSDLSAVKRIGLTAIVTYACTTILAVLVGAILATVFMPLATAMVDPRLVAATLATAGTVPVVEGPPAIFTILAEMIPQGNLLNPFLEGNLLQIIVIAIAIGIATLAILNMAGEAMVEGARVVVQIAEYAMGLFLRLLSWTMMLVPFATFGFMFDAIVKQQSVAAMFAIIGFALIIVLGLLTLMTLYAVTTKLIRGLTLRQIARAARDPLLITFSTASSSVAMPYTMKAAEEKFGVSPQIARTTVPLGATVNMDGTSVYQVMALVFLISLFGDIAGVSVTLGTLTTIGLLVVLYSVGTPGVPGGSVKVIQDVLAMFGMPPGVIGIILPMDRLLDMSRSAVNVSGDLFTACVTDRLCQPLPGLREDLTQSLHPQRKGDTFSDSQS